MTDAHLHHHVIEATTGSVNMLSAAWGGFESFYTIWFFCLLQISPFFLAFMAASGAVSEGGLRTRLGRIWSASLPCSAGYIVFFALLGSTALPAGMVVFRYHSLLGQLGGILGLLLGAWLLGALRTVPEKLVMRVGGFLLGGALALNYRPCATPTLTLINNLTKDPAAADIGGLYMAVYATGVCAAFLLAGFSLSALLFYPGRGVVMKWTRIAGGLLLVIFGILVVADWMTVYKSWLVGGFV